MTIDEDKKMTTELISAVIEALIRELEMQGKDTVTTAHLRKFIHNMETNKKVVGKVYRGKIDV